MPGLVPGIFLLRVLAIRSSPHSFVGGIIHAHQHQKVLCRLTIFSLFAKNAESAEIDRSMIGWTVVDVSAIQQDIGMGFDRVLILQNGMVFKINGIGFPALPMTKAILFGKKVSATEMLKLGMADAAKNMPDGFLMLKILIGKDMYDAQQVGR